MIEIDPLTGVEINECQHQYGAITAMKVVGNTLYASYAGSPSSSSLVIVGL